jgi:hypothetical protein
MFVNHTELKEINIVAMNLLSDRVYAFTLNGEFLEFEVDIQKKAFYFSKKRNIKEFVMVFNQ